jgi:hypothetical protein
MLNKKRGRTGIVDNNNRQMQLITDWFYSVEADEKQLTTQ